MDGMTLTDVSVPVDGHRALADLMGRNRDVAIFKRYPALNNLDLLYRQAELERLEVDLADTAREDAVSDYPDHREYAYDFDKLRKADDVQWKTILTVRERLKEYNEALLLNLQLASYRSPEKLKLHALQSWQRTRPTAKIKGADYNIYDGETVNEFVVLQAAKQDPLSRWVDSKVTSWWIRGWRWLGRRNRAHSTEDALENAIIEYDPEPFSLLAAIISTLVSVLILNACVISLYFIHNMLARLLVASAFTLVFSMALTLTTEARKVEVFAATCAFAAVQIVYVGSTLVNQGNRDGASKS